MERRIDPTRGAYDTRRASALSGVPVSTLHSWARRELVTPSAASSPRTRLWSWGDLVLLRTIDWLRHTKDEPTVKRTQSRAIGELVRYLRGRPLVEELARIAIAGDGTIFLREGEVAARHLTTGQLVDSRVLPLVSPYASGPDLLQPRPLLSILPGKLAGEPHVTGTRISTPSIYALHIDGYSPQSICSLFPDLSVASVHEAIALERQLTAA